MTSKVHYKGALRTVASHLASGSKIETDAPVDNHGRGERFSPTDLVATALASCMLTVMGIVADRNGYNLEGTECEVTKEMSDSPRRIARIVVVISFPTHAPKSAKDRTILERAAATCPVHQSLHPDIVQDISFHWAALQDG